MSSRPNPREVPVNASPRVLRFDSYEVDLESGELRKGERRIPLQAQPMQLLTLLLQNPGQLVTREEVRGELWPADTFVDFDRSLATAVNKIREALGDSAENPKFVETLPKRGYRFIGQLKPPEELPPLTLVAGKTPVASQADHAHRVDASSRKSGRLKPLLWVLIGAAAAAAIFVGVDRWRASQAKNDRPLTPTPFAAYEGNSFSPSFSPDGSQIAFAWDGGNPKQIMDQPQIDLYAKALNSETLLQLTHHPSHWISPAWSPDGTRIAFHRLGGDSGIFVVPALGGPERKLKTTHVPYDLAAAISWSPDGKWLAYDDTIDQKPGDRMFLLSMDTLESHPFPHDPACNHEADLTFSHDGKHVAYLCVHTTNWFEVFTSDPEGKTRTSVLSFPWFMYGMAWTRDDKGLVVSQQTDKGARLLEVHLKDRAVRELPLQPAGLWPAVSAAGDKLAYTTPTTDTNLWRRDLKNPQAPPVRMFPYSQAQQQGEFSPDGKRIVFVSTIRGQSDVWVSDADGGNVVEVSKEQDGSNPHWAPDSRKIAYDASYANGDPEIYVVDIDERTPRKLATNVLRKSHPSWSHDGQWIYFRGYEKIGYSLYRCPATGGNATLLLKGQDVIAPKESADGKSLYFLTRDVDAAVRVLPLGVANAPDTELIGMPNVEYNQQWQVTTNGIYFVEERRPETALYFDFNTRHTKELFKGDKAITYGISVSPDGRYILYSQLDRFTTSVQLVEHFH
jgi:Tol biopolymer transport system component/DNA-binding winged helix-turn-helix (wHTH) protein